MRLTLRLSLLLALGVGCVSLLFAYSQTRSEAERLRRDLQRQALVLAESLARPVEPLVEKKSYRDLQKLMNQFQDREQISGIAVYGAQAEPLATTSGLTAQLPSTPGAISAAVISGSTRSEFFQGQVGPMHVTALPIRSGNRVTGALAIFHDATHIDSELARLWRRAYLTVTIQTLLVAIIALLTLRWGLGRPVLRMARWLREMRAGAWTEAPQLNVEEEFAPLTQEVRRLASSLHAARASAIEEARLRASAESHWTAERLRVFVNNRLAGRHLFVVSNREPYEHYHRPEGIWCTTPASGLVTALEPVLRACDGTWIAQGTGDADRATVDRYDHVRVPPEHPQYTLRRVWLSRQEEQGFYLGFANEGLWPLCHIAHTRPVFRPTDWEHYRKVNHRFADVLLQEIEGEEEPVVLVQDYHFALMSRTIKERRPDARVAIFWHIPWPNPEAFGICPWQRDLLDGLLGADLVGFHIQAHCNNFLETVDRFLESRIDWDEFSVARRMHQTRVRAIPISVAPDDNSGLEAPNAAADLLAQLGVRGLRLGVGVDRIDYTKGIPERFRGVETFFDRYPSFRGEFTFVQIGSPSRTEIRRYHDLTQEIEAEAERINRRFQTGNWRPLVLLARQHSHAEIQPYYRAADLCLVTSLHDGMNLVAKEFVACRSDEGGVLILSRFAGAAYELTDSLIVNPYDTEQIADAIYRSLTMPAEEKRLRMQRMRGIVREHNIYRWAATLIQELCAIRTTTGEPVRRRASADAAQSAA
jgi:trehalose-6-phosphate synthase/GAF domain-containing protein